MDRIGHTNRLQHPGGSIGDWAAAFILIVKRSRLQRFLSVRFCGATALTRYGVGDDSLPLDDSLDVCMESGGLHAYMKGIITIHHR